MEFIPQMNLSTSHRNQTKIPVISGTLLPFSGSVSISVGWEGIGTVFILAPTLGPGKLGARMGMCMTCGLTPCPRRASVRGGEGQGHPTGRGEGRTLPGQVPFPRGLLPGCEDTDPEREGKTADPFRDSLAEGRSRPRRLPHPAVGRRAVQLSRRPVAPCTVFSLSEPTDHPGVEVQVLGLNWQGDALGLEDVSGSLTWALDLSLQPDVHP